MRTHAVSLSMVVLQLQAAPAMGASPPAQAPYPGQPPYSGQPAFPGSQPAPPPAGRLQAERPRPLVNPWLAAGLSVGLTPLVIGAGAGQIYAGDFWRGVTISAVEPAALVSFLLIGGLVGLSLRPDDRCDALTNTPFRCDRDTNSVAYPTLFALWGAYGAFAGVDAYYTAQRRNDEILGASSPGAAPR